MNYSIVEVLVNDVIVQTLKVWNLDLIHHHPHFVRAWLLDYPVVVVRVAEGTFGGFSKTYYQA